MKAEIALVSSGTEYGVSIRPPIISEAQEKLETDGVRRALLEFVEDPSDPNNTYSVYPVQPLRGGKEEPDAILSRAQDAAEKIKRELSRPHGAIPAFSVRLLEGVVEVTSIFDSPFPAIETVTAPTL